VEPEIEEAPLAEMPEVETSPLPEEPMAEEAVPPEIPEVEKPPLPEEPSELESGPEVKEVPPSEQKDAGQGESDTKVSTDSPSSGGQTAHTEPESSAREGDEGQARQAQDTGEEPQ
jgi:hypothetical protein